MQQVSEKRAAFSEVDGHLPRGLLGAARLPEPAELWIIVWIFRGSDRRRTAAFVERLVQLCSSFGIATAARTSQLALVGADKNVVLKFKEFNLEVHVYDGIFQRIQS